MTTTGIILGFLVAACLGHLAGYVNGYLEREWTASIAAVVLLVCICFIVARLVWVP